MSSDHESRFTDHVPPPCKEEVVVHYVDDNILVVDKPAGLLSVSGRFVKDSVLHRMMFDYPDAVIVHRLDLDTSGLLVLALSKSAVKDLNRQFRNRVVEKKYLPTFGDTCHWCRARSTYRFDLIQPIGPARWLIMSQAKPRRLSSKSSNTVISVHDSN